MKKTILFIRYGFIGACMVLFVSCNNSSTAKTSTYDGISVRREATDEYSEKMNPDGSDPYHSIKECPPSIADTRGEVRFDAKSEGQENHRFPKPRIPHKNKKAGLLKVNHDDFKTIHPNFKLSSIAIENGFLLDAYKCEQKVNGIENSIPLSWQNVPEGTKSLAIVMYHYPHKEDKTEVNSYLLLWDIDPQTTEIPYKMARSGDWFMGANKDGNVVSYTSPCSRGKGKHEYTIALYALSETPAGLPRCNSLDVNYAVFMNAIATVNIIDRTTLRFFDAK